MDATTSARVKEILKDSGTQNDSLIAQLITGVSQQIEKILNRHLQQTSRIESYDVTCGQRVFHLRGYPVATTPAAVFKNDIARDFAGASAIDTTAYFLDTDKGVVIVDQIALSWGAGALQATYTGGMATSTANLITSFPDVAMAADLQVAHLIQRKDQLGLATFSAEGAGIGHEAPTRMLKASMELLRPYRRMVATV